MKPVLLLDMDGVVVNLLPRWLAEYHLISGEHIAIEEITEYHHEKFVSHKQAWWYALEPALFKAAPVPGALEAVTRLSELYDIYFVTYCSPQAPMAMIAKRYWLKTHLPWFDLDKVIYTKSKHLIKGDFLVEDSVEMMDNWCKHNLGGAGLLIKAPYNPYFGMTWEEIENWLTIQSAERVNDI